MQSGVGRVDHEWLVWHDFRSLPATVRVVVIDLKHVIGLEGSEGVLVIRRRLLLKNLSLVNLKVVGKESFLHRGEAVSWCLHHHPAVRKHASAHPSERAVDDCVVLQRERNRVVNYHRRLTLDLARFVKLDRILI